MSCPPLRRKLFTGAALDAELDEVRKPYRAYRMRLPTAVRGAVEEHNDLAVRFLVHSAFGVSTRGNRWYSRVDWCVTYSVGTQVTSAAINGGAMVQLKEDGRTLMVNPIFKWYKEDFDKEGGVLAFITSRWTGPFIPEDATVDFFTYDWRTNSVDATWADRALGGPAP